MENLDASDKRFSFGVKKGLTVNTRYFLNQRLAFLRQLHQAAIAQYVERKRLIDAEEEPFTPKYEDDSGEPSYLEEYLEAEESIQVLGRACASMLAATLKVYLETWQKLVNAPIDSEVDAMFKKNWLTGYQAYFAKHAGVEFAKCPVNLQLLEELVLARNRVQHPNSLTTESSRYSSSDLKKLPHPFFIDESDRELFATASEGKNEWLLALAIDVTPEKFEESVKTIEQFAEWLEAVESEGSAQ